MSKERLAYLLGQRESAKKVEEEIEEIGSSLLLQLLKEHKWRVLRVRDDEIRLHPLNAAAANAIWEFSRIIEPGSWGSTIFSAQCENGRIRANVCDGDVTLDLCLLNDTEEALRTVLPNSDISDVLIQFATEAVVEAERAVEAAEKRLAEKKSELQEAKNYLSKVQAGAP